MKTQAGRKLGGSQAENNGANADQCNKLGNYQMNSRTACYTQDVVAWEAVRTLAGSEPGPKKYYLKRALLTPPESLQQLIFPKLEQSISDMLNQEEIAGYFF